MEIKTEFSCGDKVYVLARHHWPSKIESVSGPLTVGQVRVSVTDSAGIDGEEVFDNYKPKKGYEESYMLVETGIGTGTVYGVKNMFHTSAGAHIEALRRNQLIEGEEK